MVVVVATGGRKSSLVFWESSKHFSVMSMEASQGHVGGSWSVPLMSISFPPCQCRHRKGVQGWSHVVRAYSGEIILTVVLYWQDHDRLYRSSWVIQTRGTSKYKRELLDREKGDIREKTECTFLSYCPGHLNAHKYTYRTKQEMADSVSWHLMILMFMN